MSDKPYIGLLSGTSVDAIDAAIIHFDSQQTRIIHHHSHALSPDAQKHLRALIHNRTPDITTLLQMDHQLGHYFADAVDALCEKAACRPADIAAIGSHGQTLYHAPRAQPPFSLQIGDANIIAARTGITTVTDFRRADIAHGGQGAPLAPAFHAYWLRDLPGAQAVINIGGFANISLINGHAVQGFDTGPGNALLDAWYRQHHPEAAFDKNGDWVASGNCNPIWLKTLLSDPYFQQSGPKSTGHDYFNLPWLRQTLGDVIDTKPADTQATLLALTAHSIAQAIPPQSNIILCGGGAYNIALKKLLAQLATQPVKISDDYGIAAEWMETALFAWLAKMRLAKQPIALGTVTGAKCPAILGSVYA